MEFVNGKVYIPYMKWKKNMLETTNQAIVQFSPASRVVLFSKDFLVSFRIRMQAMAPDFFGQIECQMDRMSENRKIPSGYLT